MGVPVGSSTRLRGPRRSGNRPPLRRAVAPGRCDRRVPTSGLVPASSPPPHRPPLRRPSGPQHDHPRPQRDQRAGGHLLPRKGSGTPALRSGWAPLTRSSGTLGNHPNMTPQSRRSNHGLGCWIWGVTAAGEHSRLGWRPGLRWGRPTLSAVPRLGWAVGVVRATGEVRRLGCSPRQSGRGGGVPVRWGAGAARGAPTPHFWPPEVGPLGDVGRLVKVGGRRRAGWRNREGGPPQPI